MDGTQFDTLTRALVELRSRRGLGRLLGGLVVAGSLPRLGSAATTAKGKKAKKKRKKKARPQPPVAPPPAFSCQGQPDDTPCNGDGRCLLGRCNPRPNCQVRAVTCAGASPPCCGSCETEVPFTCLLSVAGQPCYESADCQAGLQCIGYTCRSPVCGLQFECRGVCFDATCGAQCGETCGTLGQPCCSTGSNQLTCKADVISGQNRCLP
jgi:hypothetical protein